jgi:hypothetical protein
MANEFNINKLIMTGHGYVGLPFPKLDLKGLIPDVNLLGKAILGKNILGRPFFMDCVIDGVRLPNEPLITITGKKTIVETVVVGSDRKGTVKEFISAGDYNIKIEGICIEPNGKEYPTEQVESIVKLIEKNETLEVENEILNTFFKVNALVIKDYGFGNMQGKPYSQSYYLTCISDEDFYGELKLKNL